MYFTNLLILVNLAILVNLVILNLYTAERREVSENTPPEAQENYQGWGFCTPRPERLPEGEARGQSREPNLKRHEISNNMKSLIKHEILNDMKSQMT